MTKHNTTYKDIKIVSEEEAINSLFTRGGTKVNGNYLVVSKLKRKNSKEIYFSFGGVDYCINKHNRVILNFRLLENNKKWFSISTDFSEALSYKEVNMLEDNIIDFALNIA